MSAARGCHLLALAVAACPGLLTPPSAHCYTQELQTPQPEATHNVSKRPSFCTVNHYVAIPPIARTEGWHVLDDDKETNEDG